MAMTWQWYGNDMAMVCNSMVVVAQCDGMAKVCQWYGNGMTMLWPWHGNGMAIVWF